jgi:hypothetical protein
VAAKLIETIPEPQIPVRKELWNKYAFLFTLFRIYMAVAAASSQNTEKVNNEEGGMV